MTVSSMGVALRQIVPQIVTKKITSYFELIKPLIEFNFENVQSRSNNMFELATQEEINKLTAGGTSNSSSVAKFTDEIGMKYLAHVIETTKFTNSESPIFCLLA